MKYSRVPTLIAELCSDATTTFLQKTTALFEQLETLDREAVTTHIEYGGVIPESYSHDSSEEKLFAKYCDWLLAKALEILDMRASVVPERSDAADVIARTDTYSLVGDAKAFRLSRTAKNQKDFKVEALSQWKNKADFACLTCPLYQYPTTNSQIYAQATRYKVTLLSFTHLGFMLRSKGTDPTELHNLWQLSGGLPSGKKAIPYWNAISQQVAKVVGRPLAEWDAYVVTSKELLNEQASEQVKFWKSEKTRIRKLDHDEAVEALISALRIDGNINRIQKKFGTLRSLLQKID